MSINKISGRSAVSPTTGINTPSSRTGTQEGYYKFNERFDFAELELARQLSESDEETIKLGQMFYTLIRDVLVDGCDIVSRGALTDKVNVIEASFEPPHKKMGAKICLPLRNGGLTIEASRFNLAQFRNMLDNELRVIVDGIVTCNNNQNLLKLIILLSHEYGHYKSYQRGYHDPALKLGLQLMHTRQISASNDKHVYQVFSEEATAWRLAKEVLAYHFFDYWSDFDKIMYKSLSTYYRLLKLDSASISVYCSLSMLDVDLRLIAAI